MVGVLSARGIATFWSFLVSPFGTGTLLLFSVIVGSRVPLAQLFFQVMVLLSKAFYSRGESLYLSFEGNSAWFISLVVVGCHQTSKYHTTLCLGNGSMATIIFSLQTDGAKGTRDPKIVGRSKRVLALK